MPRHFCNPVLALALLCTAWASTARAGDLPGTASLMNGVPAVESIGREAYAQMVMEEAARQGVPPALADAVAVVESGYNVMARGTSGEVGLMQILPATAMQLGFSGSTDALFVPWTNIHYGVAYLAHAWSLSGGSVCRTLMKYRAGWGQEAFSPLSIDYCARASAYLDGQGVSSLDTAAPTQPPPEADPYVVSIGPALKVQKTLYTGQVRTRSQEDKTGALNARWRAHQRHS